jgi:hypothetical protein
MSWKGESDFAASFQDFNLSTLNSKIKELCHLCLKYTAEYKMVVHEVERFIRKSSNQSEKVAGLYLIDAICKASRAQHGKEKEVFAKRFSQRLLETIKFIPFDQVSNNEKQRINRMFGEWTKAEVFPPNCIPSSSILGLDKTNDNEASSKINEQLTNSNLNNSSFTNMNNDNIMTQMNYYDNSASQPYNNNANPLMNIPQTGGAIPPPPPMLVPPMPPMLTVPFQQNNNNINNMNLQQNIQYPPNYPNVTSNMMNMNNMPPSSKKHETNQSTDANKTESKKVTVAKLCPFRQQGDYKNCPFGERCKYSHFDWNISLSGYLNRKRTKNIITENKDYQTDWIDYEPVAKLPNLYNISTIEPRVITRNQNMKKIDREGRIYLDSSNDLIYALKDLHDISVDLLDKDMFIAKVK